MKDSKSIEKHLIELMEKKSIDNKDVYTETAIRIYNHLLDNGINYFEKPTKPKVKTKPVYSNKNEPKTDILFHHDKKEYKLSVKKDESAYIVSCNSQEDFIKIFIELFDGYNILDSEIIDELKEASTKISKIPNFYSFDRSYSNNSFLFVNEKFVPKATKYVGKEKALEYSNYIVECYSNQELKLKYINHLNEAESLLQNTIKKLFLKYPDYSKKIIFELVTGKIKFSNSSCSCNFIADVNGLYSLEDYTCEYVNQTYTKFLNMKKIGRLQNVPRKTINKKTLLGGNLKEISEQFSVADLTFKI